MCVCCNTFLASHIDTNVLADGMYELIPESEGGDQEAQVNAATPVSYTHLTLPTTSRV